MRFYSRRVTLVWLALIGLFFSASTVECKAALVGETQIVALANLSIDTGHIPRLNRLHTPVINDRGDFVFYSQPYQTSLRVFQGGSSTLAEVPTIGTTTTDGERVLTVITPKIDSKSLLQPIPNSAGSIVFPAASKAASGEGPSILGIYRRDTELVELLRIGQPAPDGNGTFSNFSDFVFNDAGEVAYIGQLTGLADMSLSSTGIFLSGSGGTIEIARQGRSAPNGDGIFASFYSFQEADPTYAPNMLSEAARRFRFALNDKGQVAFLSGLQGTADRMMNGGIFLGDGDTIVEITRLPYNFSLSEFQLQLNNSGQVAFGNENGIFKSSGGFVEDVALRNQTIPNDVGKLSTFRYFQMNESGDIAFLANIKDNPNNAVSLFQADGSDLRLLVRSGQSAPDGDGVISLGSTWSFAYNDVGQIAFVADVRNATDRANQGLFLYDPIDGLIQVARSGEEYEGGWFTQFSLAAHDAANLEGLNNRGQIAFRFQLHYIANEGIALWTPVPEPSAYALAVFAVLVLGLTAIRSRVTEFRRQP